MKHPKKLTKRPASRPSGARTLVLSLQPYRYSTRPKKAASIYAQRSETLFLAPSKIGRSKQWDSPFHSRLQDNLIVRQLFVGRLRTAPSLTNQLKNAFGTYLPLLLRWCREILRAPADEVFSTSLSLAPLAILHKLRYRSKIVIDINERPGAKTVSGSVTSLAAGLEPLTIKFVACLSDVITTATPGDRDALSTRYPNRQVQLLRNLPLESWRARFVMPAPSEILHIITVGSIFEGRAFEILISAIGIARARGVKVELDIYGTGRDDYVDSLHQLISDLGLDDAITLRGLVATESVSSTYLSGDVGLALYETARTANDGLSNKILECVSSGRPVIAGDLPENRRFVSENNVGWLTDVNPEALAVTIGTVAAYKDLEAVARRCRKLGDAELSWEREFKAALRCL